MKAIMKRFFARSIFLLGVFVTTAAGAQEPVQEPLVRRELIQFLIFNGTPASLEEERGGPPPATPLVHRLQSRSYRDMAEEYDAARYEMFGYIRFSRGGAEAEQVALRYAKDVGADLLVIFDPKYAGKTPPPKRAPSSWNNDSGLAHWMEGDYGAVFLVRHKPPKGFGAVVRPLMEARELAKGIKAGVFIRMVYDDSLASETGFKAGDIITSVDGEAADGMYRFESLLQKRKGKTVSISFIRNGQAMQKSITLRP